MKSDRAHPRWLRSATLAFAVTCISMGAATPSPADDVSVCAGAFQQIPGQDRECSEPVPTPNGSTNAACGPGSPGATARQTIYRVYAAVGDDLVWICDREAAKLVGVAPGYIVVGTTEVYVVAYPDE